MAKNIQLDLQSALEAFRMANPDLPEGETVDSEESKTESAKVPRLDIVFEKKGRGGKQATIITGFVGTDDELQSLASALKRRLATGGSARGGEILIQGDRKKDVLRLLSEMGYKARII